MKPKFYLNLLFVISCLFFIKGAYVSVISFLILILATAKGLFIPWLFAVLGGALALAVWCAYAMVRIAYREDPSGKSYKCLLVAPIMSVYRYILDRRKVS
jgi:hypothetical protein